MLGEVKMVARNSITRNQKPLLQSLRIVLTPKQQLAFWNALQAPVKLTPAQKKLGAIMRGEA